MKGISWNWRLCTLSVVPRALTVRQERRISPVGAARAYSKPMERSAPEMSPRTPATTIHGHRHHWEGFCTGSKTLTKSNDATTVYGIVDRIISRETKNFQPSLQQSAAVRPLTSAKQPFTIIVEGNIGSGKTTFLKHFKKFSNVAVVDEPVEKWRNAQGHNLFDLMYKDPVKWSFCFQSYVQLTMLDLHTKPTQQAVKLMERSIFSAKYCFVNNLRDQGLLADVEYTVLDEWFSFIRESVPIKVDLIVYLRTDPEVVFERISQRGRPEESAVTLEYLKSIHNLHEDWLQNKSQFVPCPVITIDANDDLASMKKNYKTCEETIFQRAAVAN